MTEANPVEAIKNNVFGTRNLVDASLQAGTRRFVLISTDKTVGPRSVYGVTKKIAEEIVLGADGGDSLSFMVVRFGNVLGSRGSIVPLFQRQILKGGPVTVTHPEASRYFMTIPEAASLVLQTGGVGRGGELYVLDMGERLLIKDLAEQMIRFYGFEPEKEIPIQYIGLRPGEKLNEALWNDGESAAETEYRKIYRILRDSSPLPSLEKLLADLAPICFFDPARPDRYRNRRILRSLLRTAVPTLEAPPHEPEY